MGAANEIKLSNVVDLFDNKVSKDLQNYFNDLETFSKNTKNSYKRDIECFFVEFLNKDINHLNEEDLQIDKKTLLSYRKHLIDSGKYKNATINRRIRGLKSFYDTLSSYGYEVNLNVFKKIRELPNKSQSYGVLTLEEALQMPEVALVTEREKKYIKFFLIHTAIRSSLRISDLLALKWDDFKIKDDLVLIELYEMKTDKDAIKPLVKEFYEKLLSIKTEQSEFVFNIDTEAVGHMMKRITKYMGIDENRNVKFHSFRNVGVNLVIDVTKDIKAAAAQANHSNINTTYNSYVDRTRDYDNMAGVLIDRELDQEILEELSKKELMNLINKLSFGSKNELIKLANLSKK